jgi:hypothetical protein
VALNTMSVIFYSPINLSFNKNFPQRCIIYFDARTFLILFKTCIFSAAFPNISQGMQSWYLFNNESKEANRKCDKNTSFLNKKKRLRCWNQ